MPLEFGDIIPAPALADLPGELLDQEEGGGGGNPLPGVDARVDEDDGKTGVVGVDLDYFDVPPLVGHPDHLASHCVILEYNHT